MCDCIFNRLVPSSTNKIFIIRPYGKTFVNGLAQSYEEEYDASILKPHLKKSEYLELLDKLNDTLFHYFPCTFCLCFGYLCCPLTAGLSFIFPHMCINDARTYAERVINQFNKYMIENGKPTVYARLVLHCSTSWVEIHLDYKDGQNIGKSQRKQKSQTSSDEETNTNASKKKVKKANKEQEYQQINSQDVDQKQIMPKNPYQNIDKKQGNAVDIELGQINA
eukprot:403333757